MEFRGIPVSVKEDTSDLICKVASLVGVEITAVDISTSHRINPKTDLSKFPPPIIAKFVSRDTRDEVYRARGKLRDFSTKDLNNLGRLAVNSIFMSESLTEMNKKLFNSALTCKKISSISFFGHFMEVFSYERIRAVQVKSRQVLVNLRQPAFSFLFFVCFFFACMFYQYICTSLIRLFYSFRRKIIYPAS